MDELEMTNGFSDYSPMTEESDNFFGILGLGKKGQAMRRNARDERRAWKREKWANKRATRQEKGAQRLAVINAKNAGLQRDANLNDQPIEESATQYLAQPQNSAQLQQYIQSQGEQPVNGTANQAYQAWLLRQQQIAQVQDLAADNGTPMTEDDANLYLLGDEADFDGFDTDADSFAPIVAAISAIGAKAAEIIRAKRYQNGKPFLGETEKQFNARKAGERQQSILSQLAGAGIDEIEAAKKKEFLKQNWIFILLAIVAIIGATYFLVRKKSS